MGSMHTMMEKNPIGFERMAAYYSERTRRRSGTLGYKLNSTQRSQLCSIQDSTTEHCRRND